MEFRCAVVVTNDLCTRGSLGREIRTHFSVITEMKTQRSIFRLGSTVRITVAAKRMCVDYPAIGTPNPCGISHLIFVFRVPIIMRPPFLVIEATSPSLHIRFQDHDLQIRTLGHASLSLSLNPRQGLRYSDHMF
ncbi:hypothetical protein PM082_012648 [Marasmius tenuissimus]|nr:hypothetical protein PM082_012648 [Marasmius tenuissimus]